MEDLLWALAQSPWGRWTIPPLLIAIAVCAWVAPVLPPATEQSSTWWRIGRRVIDLAAGNVGNARNAIRDRGQP